VPKRQIPPQLIYEKEIKSSHGIKWWKVFHHGGRNLETTRVRWIHVGATWPSTNEHPKLWEAITCNPKLGFEPGRSH
jgi:hypothetical protein